MGEDPSGVRPGPATGRNILTDSADPVEKEQVGASGLLQITL